MENYVLYEELSQSHSCTVYKGRRKGSIEYVAVHCLEKCLRPNITNTVRLIHDTSHKNVVKFYEWYETSNHLWVVTELCVGGTLQDVLVQDGALPEETVRTFALDLARGLCYLHSLGIVFCDFSPTKILVDSPGTLKFSEFSLARMEGENLASVYTEAQFMTEETEDKLKQPDEVNLNYAAPEILDGSSHSVKSDLWSFGILLFEMFSGYLPFSSENGMKAALSNEMLTFSKTGKPPTECFQDLIYGLLTKDPNKRFGWDEVIIHPFWQGELDDADDDCGSPRRDISSVGAVSQSGSGISERSGSQHEGIASPPMSPCRESIGPSEEGLGSSGTPRPRPIGSKGSSEPVMFTLSSRPFTTVIEEKKSMTSPLLPTLPSPAWKALQSPTTRDSPFWDSVLSLLYHSSDLIPSPIAENPRFQKLHPLQWEIKSLPTPPLSVPECLELPTQDFQSHWERLLDAITPSQRCSLQKRIHILNYLISLVTNQSLVTRITGYETLKRLVSQFRNLSQHDVIFRICRVVALVASNMTYLEKDANFTEVVLMVTEALRGSFRDSRLRQALLAALGELVFLSVRMENEFQCQLDNWAVPPVTITIINRCLQECEDGVTNHCAAKIIENIACIQSRLARTLVQYDISQALWCMFTRTAVDTLRITAVSALCRLTVHSFNVFQAVLEKVGLPAILDALHNNSSRVQQAMITMIGALLAAGIHTQKLTQEKNLHQKILRLLESPSTVLRAKSFLVIAELVKHNRDVLIVCCQARLVMYIERDSRHQSISDSGARTQWDYMYRCVELLISVLVEQAPSILNDLIVALKAVHGRKHPNNVQSRQLRLTLPLLRVYLHLITSQVFRPKIINETFFIHIGSLLDLIKSSEIGDTAIDFACGVNAQDDLVNTTFSILEAVSQHPRIMDQYSGVIAGHVLGPLASLVISQSCDVRLFCLKIFTDIVTLYLNKAEINEESLDGKVISTIHEIVLDILFPHMEEFLVDHDPLPSYALKLLQAVLEQNAAFVREIEKLGLISLLFQLLKAHHDNPLSSTVQSIVSILACLLSDKSIPMNELYDLSLINHLGTLVSSTANLCLNTNPSGVTQDVSFTLIVLLDSVFYVLSHITNIVRKTLQAQKDGVDIDPLPAEQLLNTNKPLAELSGYFSQLLCHHDADIQDAACRLLSQLVQLYGSECHFALLPSNIDCFGIALQQASNKKQKVLIKTLLRLVTAEPELAYLLQDHGKVLIPTLRDIAASGKSSGAGDGTTIPLTKELLKAIDAC